MAQILLRLPSYQQFSTACYINVNYNINFLKGLSVVLNHTATWAENLKHVTTFTVAWHWQQMMQLKNRVVSSKLT